MDKREKVRLGSLFIAILIMALLQVIGVASILPFMQLVADPEAANDGIVFQWIQQQLGFDDSRTMLIATGFGVFFFIVIGNLFSAFTVWLQHKYAWQIAHNISTRLLNNYLLKPYEFFLNVNTSVLLNKALIEVVRFTKEVLIQLIEFVARSMIVLVIFTLLIWVDVQLAIIALAAFGGAYVIGFGITRSFLSNQGKNRTEANEKLFKSINEALNGIKTVKLYEAESFFYRRYEAASSRLIRIYPQVKLVTDTPRFLIEILAFGGILGIILYLLIKGDSVQNLLPVLSLYALAGYRLLPALQKAYAAAASLKHSFNLVDKIHEDLESIPSGIDDPSLADNVSSMPTFSQKINLIGVDFGFGDKNLFTNLEVCIEQGTIVAVVGATGSGKTTLINLIAGLLEPQHGVIQVDNTILNRSNVRSWNSQIGYVPQEVFLFDDSISRNIAMGLEDQKIDIQQVEFAAKIANLHEFISDLPEGYQTKVGDRGVRLSGGQKQRIGLARAFYRNPKLLILDEATNALDSITESAVIKSINKNIQNLTVIIVAHRLSTVKHADNIFLLQEGQILDQGDYDSLLSRSEVFKEMTQVS